MKEYRVKKGLRRLVYVLSLIWIIVCGGLAFTEMYKPVQEKGYIEVFLAGALMSIVAIIAVKKNKIIITEESIISIGLLLRIEIKFNEIKDFNIVCLGHILLAFEYVSIISICEKKNICISNFIENRKEIESLLDSKIADLD